MKRANGLMGSSSRPPAERAIQKIALVDGVQDVGDRPLQRAVRYVGHSYRAMLLAVTRFGYVYPFVFPSKGSCSRHPLPLVPGVTLLRVL